MKKRLVRVWYFQRGKMVPLFKTKIQSMDEKTFLSFFNEDFISCDLSGCDYFVIKCYARYY